VRRPRPASATSCLRSFGVLLFLLPLRSPRAARPSSAPARRADLRGGDGGQRRAARGVQRRLGDGVIAPRDQHRRRHCCRFSCQEAEAPRRLHAVFGRPGPYGGPRARRHVGTPARAGGGVSAECGSREIYIPPALDHGPIKMGVLYSNLSYIPRSDIYSIFFLLRWRAGSGWIQIRASGRAGV
jgi:hypothetical protein